MSTPIAFTPPLAPSRTSSQARTPRVLLAQYGDGYEQRLQDGLNTRGLTVTAIWGALTHADADTIVAFFEARAGVEPFTYTMPPSSTNRRWVCSEWTRTEIDDLASSITAAWREVFDI